MGAPGEAKAASNSDTIRGMPLRLIGYWRNEDHPDYPEPSDLIDRDWPDQDRDDIASYLRGGIFFRGFMGLSPCRICGQHNGSSEFTDGVLVWPEGLAHYLTEHAVRLPPSIENYVRQQMDYLDSQKPDIAWWTSGAPPTTSIDHPPLAPLRRLAWFGNVQLVQDPDRRHPQLLIAGDTLHLHADGPKARRLVTWYEDLMRATEHDTLPYTR